MSWPRLAAMSQDGDKRAYSHLLMDIAPFARAIVSRRITETDTVEDIVQEILLSVHKSLHTYSPERPFKPWLISIINFRTTDYLRQHYRKERNITKSLQDDEAGHDATILSAGHVTGTRHTGEFKDIEDAMEYLTDKQKQLVNMVKIQGLTMKEAADEMNMSVSAVKVTVHRALNKITHFLGRES